MLVAYIMVVSIIDNLQFLFTAMRMTLLEGKLDALCISKVTSFDRLPCLFLCKITKGHTPTGIRSHLYVIFCPFVECHNHSLPVASGNLQICVVRPWPSPKFCQTHPRNYEVPSTLNIKIITNGLVQKFRTQQIFLGTILLLFCWTCILTIKIKPESNMHNDCGLWAVCTCRIDVPWILFSSSS